MSIMGKMEMVPHLPALMQLGSVKEVLKGFLWQGAAPGAHVSLACERAVMACLALLMVCLALRGSTSETSTDCSRLPICIVPLGQLSTIQAGTRLPLESGAGRVCFVPVQGGIFSRLPLPRNWIWGWSVILRLKLRLPCCVLAFLLESSCGSSSCCSADWDAGLGGCSKQQVLHGWVSHCGELVGRGSVEAGSG